MSRTTLRNFRWPDETYNDLMYIAKEKFNNSATAVLELVIKEWAKEQLAEMGLEKAPWVLDSPDPRKGSAAKKKTPGKTVKKVAKKK